MLGTSCMLTLCILPKIYQTKPSRTVFTLLFVLWIHLINIISCVPCFQYVTCVRVCVVALSVDTFYQLLQIYQKID